MFASNLFEQRLTVVTGSKHDSSLNYRPYWGFLIDLKMITSIQDWFLFIDGQQNSFRFLQKTFFSAINKSRTMNKSKR